MTKNNVARIKNSLYAGGYGRAVNECMKAIKERRKLSVFTPNSEMLSRARRSQRLYSLLMKADILFPDGTGCYLMMKRSGIGPKQKTCGIDLAEILIREAVKKHCRIFILGGRPGVSARAAKKINEAHGCSVTCGSHHGYYDKSGAENEKVIRYIDSSRPDIIFVCLGFPDQETWISNNLCKLKTASVAIGLGGSADVWSGDVKRAPVAFQKAGLEWAYRLLSDPRRILRLPHLINFAFSELCTNKYS